MPREQERGREQQQPEHRLDLDCDDDRTEEPVRKGSEKMTAAWRARPGQLWLEDWAWFYGGVNWEEARVAACCCVDAEEELRVWWCGEEGSGGGEVFVNLFWSQSVSMVEEYSRRNEEGGVGNPRRDPREVVEFTVGCREVEEEVAEK
ncbi:hypothetical protein M0R45_006484 [Rubus argutus]|uniref:Uncharacterized protein n=1 Tax=Rubus argutus TaxID=59490 RepID=A0AAW1YR81_RUBAR